MKAVPWVEEQAESQRSQKAIVSAGSRPPADIVLRNFASLSPRATGLLSRNEGCLNAGTGWGAGDSTTRLRQSNLAPDNRAGVRS